MNNCIALGFAQLHERVEEDVILLVCRQLVMLCRRLNLFNHAVVAIDGSTARWLGQIASGERRDSEASHTKTDRLENKIAAFKEENQAPAKLEVPMLPNATIDDQK
ncbi:MAG: hypothetical protein NWP69_10840 [Congregibacter sp.]|nr:hypothetical protein [Congregibacter sp.]